MTIKRKSPTPGPSALSVTTPQSVKRIKFNNNQQKTPKPSFEEQKETLPIWNVREDLMERLAERQTAIIVGETGSGKTTQIPQLLFQHGYTDNNLMIGITQPRRMAAITVSQRVAYEMGTDPGVVVGFKVRFEDMTSESTLIKFMTDGILLREALHDKLLKKYGVIILDEAHERTISTDILFGVVKAAQEIRNRLGHPELRIIIMSATMDIDHFAEYFGVPDALLLKGREFKVTTYNLKHAISDYLGAVAAIIMDLHQKVPENEDFLVFLTGQDEIEAMAATLKQLSAYCSTSKMRVLPLYAALTSRKQQEIFTPSAHNTRKVVLSTNIAETSITIKGIK